jgi:hypothetical protein
LKRPHAAGFIHDWVKDFERTWNERFEALDELLVELQERKGSDGGGEE